MKTIYNTNVIVKSKTKFKRLINAVKEKGFDTEIGLYYKDESNFHYNALSNSFDVWLINAVEHTVSEKEFLELLKQHKCTK